MTTRPAPAAVKITLIGLDRVGASLALALKARPELRLTGFDRDNDLARQAQAGGLIHAAKWNLLEAAAGADLVLLGGPLADQPEWLKAFGPEVRDGGVVIGLGRLLAPQLAAAQRGLPAGRHFVAAHPLLNPAQLYDGAAGLEAARPDLFAKSLWALAAAPECAPEALKLAGDLATLVGAQPYFMDPAEHDGLAAAVDGLPVLVAHALLRAADASPGWGEMRKVADREFATATFALANLDAAALSLNRENVLRYLDALSAELSGLRDLVARSDAAALAAVLTESAERRARWETDRARGEWEPAPAGPELPTFAGALGRFFAGGLFKKRDKA
ncbi:MAG: prephenate dehydrogenase [Anaerolineales bacterium]|nr:prephenate dehydrogenase [Anaerolineales bacterium]